MLRVGIVGSDNSHALAYATLLNVEKMAGDEARAVAIWGQEPGRTREVAEKGQIETIVDHWEDMIGQVDAVFVEDRHGDLHAAHALPFLERGLPVFVDKPIARSLADVRAILTAANASGAWVTSFSSLRITDTTEALAAEVAGIGEARVGQFAGPCDFESEYGGAIFYATHTVEIALRLMGEDLRSVSAVRSGKNVSVTAIWENGAIGTFSFLGDAQYHFHATVFGTEGLASGEILANHDGYRLSAGIVLEGIKTGTRPYTDEQLVRPVAVVQAIHDSLAGNGTTVEIAPLIAQGLPE